MPENQKTITLERRSGWVLLTETAVTAASFQIIEGEAHVRAGDANKPEEEDNGWLYARGQGERKIPLTDIAYAGGTHLWGRPGGSGAKVQVDYE